MAAADSGKLVSRFQCGDELRESECGPDEAGERERRPERGSGGAVEDLSNGRFRLLVIARGPCHDPESMMGAFAAMIQSD